MPVLNPVSHHRPLSRRVVALGVTCVLAAATARAALAVDLALDDLVAQAEAIFVGEVVAMRSFWEEDRHGRVIVTRTVFRVHQTLKGPPSAYTHLDFLGGTVGEVTMSVSDVPQFRPGDRDVLFVNTAGRPVSPVVGAGDGRFRIARDPGTGADVVRTYTGAPIRSLAALSQTGAAAAPLFGPELSLAQFTAEISRQVAALRGRQ